MKKFIMPKMSVRELGQKCNQLIKSYYPKRKDKGFANSWKFFKENKFRFEDSWNLDIQVAAFILPRLYYLRHNEYFSIPSKLVQTDDFGTVINEKAAKEQWEDILDLMIEAFYRYCFVDVFDLNESEMQQDQQIRDEGLKYFAEYFPVLWI